MGISFTGIRVPPALDVNRVNWATAPLLGLAPFLAAGVFLGLLDFLGSEMALTNQRVMIRSGVLRRSTLELILSDRRGFQIRKPPLSKPLGFKTISMGDGRNFSFADPKDLVQKKEPPKPKPEPPPDEKLRLGEAPRSQSAAFADIEMPGERSQRLIRQASEQIRYGHLTEAKAIVRDLLKTDPDNAHVWYLAGHLASSPRKKREAFERALKIDPDHKKARQALDLLDEG
jgi:hypothetical protein